MIDLPKTMNEELDQAACKITGQNVKARLEVSPQRSPSTKSAALHLQRLKKMKSDESQARIFGKFQISFHVGKDVAAKFIHEGEGHAEGGWVIHMKVLSDNSTNLNDAFFGTIVKSS